MKKIIKIIIISIVVFIALFLIVLITTGKERTDVYLKSFEVSNNGKTITLKVGTTSSSGYIRKMKKGTGSDNLHLIFYSTYGFNSKIGSNETYEIDLKDDTNEIYFYIGDNKYKRMLVREKSTNKWIKDETNEVHNELNDLNYASMYIKEGTLTNVGATIIIDGLNECGDPYRLDKFDNEKWIELDTIINDYAWNAPLHTLNEKGVIELDINWEWLYGKLESGQYRLVKENDKRYYSVEFIIH